MGTLLGTQRANKPLSLDFHLGYPEFEEFWPEEDVETKNDLTLQDAHHDGGWSCIPQWHCGGHNQALGPISKSFSILQYQV